MCGIYVKLGKSNLSDSVRKLKKLEYRGYDAYGYSMIDGGGQYIRFRTTERINPNEIPIERTAIDFIGHTRWASQGNNSINDTQPVVFDKNGSREQLGRFVKRGWGLDKEKEIISIVHNGDISFFHSYTKNYLPHRVSYRIDKTGCSSDTAIACDGLDQCFREFDNLLEALVEFKKRCVGDYAIVGTTNYFKDNGEKWASFAITNRMPLFYNEFGEIASDTICLAGDYKQVVDNIILTYLDGVIQESFLKDGEVKTFKCEKINELPPPEDVNTVFIKTLEQQPKDSVMLKEIREQESLFSISHSDRFDSPSSYSPLLSFMNHKKLSKVHFFGCGSSYYAAMMASHYIGTVRECRVSYATEFNGPFNNDTLYVGITQSGATKDVIDVIEELLNKNHQVWVITNRPESYCAKLVSPNVTSINCGPELAVAATKSFTATVLTLNSLFSFHYDKNTHNKVNLSVIESQALKLSENIHNYNHALLLGRGIGYAVALEGALKIKEVSYIHAEGMPASEFKHGPIALISNDVISVFILGGSGVHFERMKLNLNQVKARNGKILGIGSKEKIDKVKDLLDYSLEIPVDQINELDYNYYLACNIALQYLAHFTAEAKGLDSAFPRHLAKSLTVN